MTQPTQPPPPPFALTNPLTGTQRAGFVVWFTGLSGAGKTTLAKALELELQALHKPCYLLDGDALRQGLNRDLGFTLVDRSENTRRVAEVAKLMTQAGLVVLVAAITPLAKDRQMAKLILGNNQYFEVFVNTPLSVCEGRDVKGLYKKARAGHLAHFTGISSPYEAPVEPWLEVNTANTSVNQAVSTLLQRLPL